MASFTPTKRPYERNPLEPNGRGKWQKTMPPPIAQQNQFKLPSGVTAFRVLCPVAKFGSIVGKGGGIVAKIRKETGAKIRIEETVPGCEERVVVITGSEKDVEASKEPSKEDKEGTSADDGDEEPKVSAEPEKDGKNEDPSATEDSKPEKPTSSAQKALMLVYERLVEGESEKDGGNEENTKPSITVRLLIFSSQVGCIFGKGKSVVKQLEADSGVNICILPKDKIPLCASSADDTIQISGAIDSVRKALQSVSKMLLENPPRDRDSIPVSNPSGPPSHPFASFPRTEAPHGNYHHHHIQGPPFPNRPFDVADYHSTVPPPFPKFHEGSGHGPVQVPPEPITYRLLCSNDKVGSIIGKGGSIIRNLQHETGCDIKVHETSPELDDRIVAITGPALPGDRISPAQDAVIRVQERIVMAAPENKDGTVLSRLLVSSPQIGCLLGKGGSVIAEMRKQSGAHIRILGKDQIPKDLAETDELVQISGDFRAVQDALLQITTRLKHHLLRDKIPPINHTGHSHVDQMPPFGPYMGRREPSPPRFHNFPPFPNESRGPVQEERSTFPHPMHNPGFPHGPERIPLAPWASQGIREGGGSMSTPDFAGPPQRRIGGFPGGNQPAVITNTTVDVVVPRALVPSIYGEEGYCLRRIREISEAKIIITEPRPEATEAVIIISGTPEQTHAAQSLLQAFVLSEPVGA